MKEYLIFSLITAGTNIISTVVGLITYFHTLNNDKIKHLDNESNTYTIKEESSTIISTNGSSVTISRKEITTLSKHNKGDDS